MKNNSDIKLYDMVFPPWIFLLYFPECATVLAASFILLCFTLPVSLFIFRIPKKLSSFIKHLLPTYLFSVLCTYLGVGVMLLIESQIPLIFYHELEIIMTTSMLIIITALIFIANLFVVFRRLDSPKRLGMSLMLAILTAPYIYVLPVNLLLDINRPFLHLYYSLGFC